jgi:hypothetical protein
MPGCFGGKMANTINDLYFKYINKVGRTLENDRYFQYLFEVVQAGNNTVKQYNQILHKVVDERWLTTIEESLDAINNIIDKPRRFITTKEEVVPVALARKITADSVRHLSMNTQFIASNENNEVMPTRILNVSTEESYDLYENRFIYHLIQRLITFIDKRTDVIFWSTGDEKMNTLTYESKVDDAYEEIEYKLEMKIKNRQSLAENDTDNMNVFMRIDRVRRLVLSLRTSSFCSIMAGCSKVHSPIQRTNLMMKDPDYRTCYKLWQFLESYDEVGYTIEVQNSALEFDEEYMFQLYTNLITNYTVFKSLLDDERNIAEEAGKKRRVIKPKFIKRIEEQIVDNYDLEDVEIRKVIIEEVTQAQLDAEAKLEEEIKARKDVEDALDEMESQMNMLNQQMFNAMEMSTAAEKRAGEAEAAMDEALTKLETETAAKDNALKEIEGLKNEADELKKQLEALKAERDAIQNEVKSAKEAAELAQLESDIAKEEAAKEIEKTKTEAADEIAKTKQAADSEISKTKAESEAKLASTKQEADNQIKRITEASNAEIEKTKSEAATEIEKTKSEAAAEIEKINNSAESEINRIKNESASEIADLNEKLKEANSLADSERSDKEAALKMAEKERQDRELAEETCAARIEQLNKRSAAEIEKTQNEARSLIEKTKAEASDEISKIKAEAEAEIAKTKTDSDVRINEIKSKSEAEISKLKADTLAEITKTKADAETQIKETKENAEAEIQKIKTESEAEIQKTKDASAAEIQKTKDASAAEIQRNKEEAATKIKKLQDKAASDVEAAKLQAESQVLEANKRVKEAENEAAIQQKRADEEASKRAKAEKKAEANSLSKYIVTALNNRNKKAGVNDTEKVSDSENKESNEDNK